MKRESLKTIMKGFKVIALKVIVGLLLFILWWREFIMYSAADEGQQNVLKEIYVVYDNSGSMAESDAWCQAAYAVETLAALMDNDDVMHIYLMSDEEPNYIKCTFPEQGGEGAEKIREDVHALLQNMKYTGHTHKDGLFLAIEDIKNSSAEDKHLLIFSDGDFNFLNNISNNDEVPIPDEVKKVAKTIYYRLGSADKQRIVGAENFFTSDGSGKEILKTFTDISNLIYDRQTVDYAKKDNQITFHLDLPVKRLIIAAQSESGEISDAGIVLSTGTSVQTTGISYQSLKKDKAHLDSKQEVAVECNYHAAVKIYASDSLMPMGEYTVQVPEDSTVVVYAEYAAEYTVLLTRVEDGAEWNLEKWEEENKLREGEYRAEIRLVNAANGEVIRESPLYDKLEQTLTCEQGGEQKDITDGQTIVIREGDCVIKGTAALEGNYPRELIYEFSAGHQLGRLELQADVPESGFDLDTVEAGKAVFEIRLLEDGNDIANCENLKLDAAVKESATGEDGGRREDSTYYTCRLEETQGKWNASLLLTEDVRMQEEMLQDCVLLLTASGEKDGQKVECKKEIPLNFSTSPREITLQMDKISAMDAWDLFWHNRFTVVPTINGETINGEEWVKQIDCRIEMEGQEEKPELIISQSSRNPLEFSLRFLKGTEFWKLRDGGTISGTVYLDVERHGQVCSGSSPLEIVLEPMSRIKKAVVCVAAVLAVYIIWLILGKWLLGCKFWGIPVYVTYEIRYGRYPATGRLASRRWLHRFIGRPFSSAVVIPLKKLNFLEFSPKVPDKLVIKRKCGNRYSISNYRAFVGNESVYRDGRPMKEEDRFLDLEDGLNLTLMGEHPVELKIYMEEM